MRKLYLYIFLLISLTSSAQKLNKIGKIVLDELPQAHEYRVIKEGLNSTINYKDSLFFNGNVLYVLPNAFIANEETADDRPDRINYHDSTGKLIVSIITPRIINFKVSKKGSFAAFYNQENILLVNLVNFTIDTLFGSHSFTFTNDEKLIYYDSEEGVIVYNDQLYACNEFPYMFLDYNSTILAFTSSKIIRLSGNDFITIREFEGFFYDARIIDNNLYVVEKIVKRKDAIYTLYKTSDLVKFEIIEKTDYK
ncbi:MAG: hypothetical protein A2W99_17395 [Bacteroidetes bacterium GWF2_33_16]|nr:MAG: hypothetical protein A2X00_14535 [Bacteroidetes bacterium GWE2_32_14]OFY06815.1 MAG: hypothetical protein A2W99_17395 [Bacteroidetes bacterium GWF2_33_16]